MNVIQSWQFPSAWPLASEALHAFAVSSSPWSGRDKDHKELLPNFPGSWLRCSNVQPKHPKTHTHTHSSTIYSHLSTYHQSMTPYFMKKNTYSNSTFQAFPKPVAQGSASSALAFGFSSFGFAFGFSALRASEAFRRPMTSFMSTRPFS